MKKIDKQKFMTHAVKTKMGSIQLADKSLVVFDGDNIELGKTVYLQDGAQDWALLPAGNYKTLDNKPFTVDEDGKVSSLTNNKDLINQAMSTQKEKEISLEVRYSIRTIRQISKSLRLSLKSMSLRNLRRM